MATPPECRFFLILSRLFQGKPSLMSLPKRFPRDPGWIGGWLKVRQNLAAPPKEGIWRKEEPEPKAGQPPKIEYFQITHTSKEGIRSEIAPQNPPNGGVALPPPRRIPPTVSPPVPFPAVARMAPNRFPDRLSTTESQQQVALRGQWRFPNRIFPNLIFPPSRQRNPSRGQLNRGRRSPAKAPQCWAGWVPMWS